ncbi:phage tail spike protein, partial [Rhodopseudomonas parapalustris]
MIILYNADETAFTGNGLCVLDDVLATVPKIVEELNGTYTLELDVAIQDRPKKTGTVLASSNLLAGTFKAGELRDNVEVTAKHDLIQKEMIIKADDNYFRIKQRRKGMRSVYVFAKQIFFTDFADNFLEDVRPSSLNGAGALNWISSHTQYSHHFTFISDISTVATAYYVRKNPVAAIMSEDNSFLKVWGGELRADKFNISINQVRGMDRGVTISYGKNLLGIEEDMNDNNVVTRAMPIGYDENNLPVLLPEKYIDSPYINNYPNPKIQTFEFSNIKVDPDNGVTLDMVYSMLRLEIQKLYDGGIDLPYYNYTVNFKDLSQTEEYKDYAVLERVYMGDTVTIKHLKLGLDLKA